MPDEVTETSLRDTLVNHLVGRGIPQAEAKAFAWCARKRTDGQYAWRPHDGGIEFTLLNQHFLLRHAEQEVQRWQNLNARRQAAGFPTTPLPGPPAPAADIVDDFIEQQQQRGRQRPNPLKRGQ